MDLGLSGKTVFVAGASRGIGLAISRSFLLEGSNVVITGRTTEDLETAHSKLAEEFGESDILAINSDMSDPDQISQAIAETEKRFKSLDNVIANIGSGHSKMGFDIAAEEWERMFNVNFVSSVLLAREVLPRLIKNKSGSFIFISSIAGLEFLPAPATYAAAKAALTPVVKSFARDVGGSNVCVNAVAPGEISTSMIKPEYEMLIPRIPLNRMGTPEDVARSIHYLCSEDSEYVTGTEIWVTGGQHMS